MGASGWVCGFVAHWWDVIGKNSGQIQIVIALIAFTVAWKGYNGVLTQIKMAKEQSQESAEQTKHFADQVKEVAKQTQYAAQQLEASNLQIQEQTKNNQMLENIRRSELYTDYVNLVLKAIEEGHKLHTVITDIFPIVNDIISKSDSDDYKKFLNEYLRVVKILDNNTLENITKLSQIPDLLMAADDHKDVDLEKSIKFVNKFRLMTMNNLYRYHNEKNEYLLILSKIKS